MERWILGFTAPTCLSALLSLAAVPSATAATPQMAVAPPPMGWTSWNAFGNDISESLIDTQADALRAFNATLKAGTPRYTHLNIDGGFWLGSNGRDGNGAPILDKTKWTNGQLNTAVAHIHADGLLAGAYTDIGKTGCGGAGGSEGYYIPDMLRFAQAGFDYVKVDFCGGRSENLDPLQTYTQMAYAKQYAAFQTGKNMYFSICDWGYYGPTGFPDAGQGPWFWAPGVSLDSGNIWRTGDDITFNVGPNGNASFNGMLLNFHANNHPDAQHTGYYNDPDMMVVGMKGVDDDPTNPVQSQANMSLWAVSGAPLIINPDLTTLPNRSAITAIFSNPTAIAIDQDGRGTPAIQVAAPQTGLEIWARLLSGSGQRAVAFLNTTTAPVAMTVSAAQLGLDPDKAMTSMDVWTKATDVSRKGKFRVAVPARGVTMLLVSGKELAEVPGTVAVNGSNTTATLPLWAPEKSASINTGPTALNITYRNKTAQTQFAVMTTNGAGQTVVALPPTGRTSGTVTVTNTLAQGLQNQLLLRPFDPSVALSVSKVAVVAGPVPVYQPIYPAYSSTSQLTGTAVAQLCSTCTAGYNVGYLGTANGGSGTLTITGVTAPKDGLYRIQVGYLNADGSGARQAAVAVNGTPAGSFSFPQAKDWNTVQVAPITVQLRKGANRLTFSNATAYAPNFAGLGAPSLVVGD